MIINTAKAIFNRFDFASNITTSVDSSGKLTVGFKRIPLEPGTNRVPADLSALEGNYISMFAGLGLDAFPVLDYAKARYIGSMFEGSTVPYIGDVCSYLSSSSSSVSMTAFAYNCASLRTVGNIVLPSFKAYGDRMFENCTSLETVGAVILPECTDGYYMFSGDDNLRTIRAYYAPNASSFSSTFQSCKSLSHISPEDFTWDGITYPSTAFKKSVSLAACPLDAESIHGIIKNLLNASGATLTISKTTGAYLTDEDKQLATSKGWTIAIK